MGLREVGLLRFEEACMERVWGGTRLLEVYGKPVVSGSPVGEAWLVSDHASHESVVADGPLAGRNLRQLLLDDVSSVLGTHAQLTVHGRFPLLLKLLDAGQALSVQVHPDDAAAARLREHDVGKTEMWHVLDAAPGAELICGFRAGAGRDAFQEAVRTGDFGGLFQSIPADAGTSVFVSAGTVHAIGAGLLLAEIQQNSDLTYRVYDWGRMGTDGKPRELYIEKALAVMDFDGPVQKAAKPLVLDREGAAVEVLAACRHFAAEAWMFDGRIQRNTGGRSFHILLQTRGKSQVQAGESVCVLEAGQAVLVPGCQAAFAVEGSGALLDYYVPDLLSDIMAPLQQAGHSREAIVALGGPSATSDLRNI